MQLLAGLAVGYWKDREELKKIWRCEKCFQPNMIEEDREKLYAGWKKSVDRVKIGKNNRLVIIIIIVKR